MVIAGASWMLGRAAASPTQTPPTTSTIRVARRSRVALVAMVIAAAGSGGPGRAEPQLSQPSLTGSRRPLPTLLPLPELCHASQPSKWYTPEACLQLREHFHGQVSAACQRRNTGTVGLKLSKVVVVGDLYVGKTSLIHRFCKNVFDRDYKATIGVDFEIERFEIAGIPYSLQIWDTAGQEKFKCIASAYYRGAQVIITAFDLTDVQTLEHTRQWLEDALRENEAGSCFIFLVGTKKDLLSGAACEQAEADAVHLAREMQAEYWSVSAKTGENVKAFFSRVAALAFEQSVLQDLERQSSARLQVGNGDLIQMEGSPPETQESKRPSSLGCC
ncbi:ras-related protein Rab-36 isoform X6 [Homo sapiens]|uniref:ras-related protein Rab-36 isoform X6 n=1 Tax=Homo sapiens TaxID=9606 RepID=UPI001FB12A8D|nr:ras-related protein Rab-36 isoform X6 [Homo sapiens]XP_054182139.1 ras-related protein Rab-36 isoform X6 [Homo sapiens]